jgi:hypothetical protein
MQTSVNKTTSAFTYTQLQSSIDEVVGKIGLNRTITLLNSFINNTTVSQSEGEKIKMITQYLVSVAIKVFDLRDDIFYISAVREYRDARMCCFHLLRKYTEDTYPKIGLNFKCSARIVMYGCTMVEDRLVVPKGNGKFVANYSLLESRLIEFVGKIN